MKLRRRNVKRKMKKGKSQNGCGPAFQLCGQALETSSFLGMGVELGRESSFFYLSLGKWLAFPENTNTTNYSQLWQLILGPRLRPSVGNGAKNYVVYIDRHAKEKRSSSWAAATQVRTVKIWKSIQGKKV